MTEENYWYSSLEPPLEAEAAAEAKIIVDAFATAKIPIEIGGFPDDAEEDDDLHAGGIAFMYDKDRILAREQYLAARDRPRTARNTSEDASKPRGILEIISETHGVQEVEVTRVVGDVVLLHLNPPRHRTPVLDYGDDGREHARRARSARGDRRRTRPGDRDA